MLSFYLTVITGESEKIDFERLYRKYYGGVYKRIFHILKNQQDAEDISQETWLKAAQNIGKLKKQEESVAVSYIMRIARNEALSLIRRREKELQAFSPCQPTEIADNETFYQTLEGHSEERVVACIHALDPIYSDALVYYYLYEHSISEIASLFSISEDTARKRLSRARARLAAKLKEELS